MSPQRFNKFISSFIAVCVVFPSGLFATGVPSKRPDLNVYSVSPDGIIFSSDYSPTPEMDQRLALNVEDLGFNSEATKSDPELQAKRDHRTKMLKIHQILGLITGAVMAGALATSGGAGESKNQRDQHAAWGIATGAMYFTTASFAFFVPKDPDRLKSSGRTKIHKGLAFIHFPAMLATMYYGITDKKKLDNGEQPSGHKTAAATIAAVSFYAALTIMVIPFGGAKE